ncbi:hypothetical protein DCAR_0623667 [Daucus carota subsp. sativus]|uniref:Uncharacterized protein n=1 Tax=Daucus carota subsp. sativus TaxID=79200 RepID=A0A164VCQ5_DAUCS|nr:hypothetical protein DCAR_0623667 [Daucus carota subsp. sativus]
MKFNTKAWIVIAVSGAVVAKEHLFVTKISTVRKSSYFRAVGASVSRVGVVISPRALDKQPMKVSETRYRKHKVRDEPLRMISFLSSWGPY